MTTALLLICLVWLAGITGWLVYQQQKATARRAEVVTRVAQRLTDASVTPGRALLRARLATRAERRRARHGRDQ